jgi:hypothetical protein
VNARPDLLELLLSPDVVAALDEHIRDVVIDTIREERARVERGEWVPLTVGAARLGCTADALRMKAKRGTIESRRQGRRVYVHLDNNGASRA